MCFAPPQPSFIYPACFVVDLRNEKSSSVKNCFGNDFLSFSVRCQWTRGQAKIWSTTKIKTWHEFNNRLRPLPVSVRGRSRRSFAMSPSEIITSKRDETFWWQTRQECAQWLWCWWTGNYEKQTSFAYTLLAVFVSFVVVVVVRLHGVKSCTLINKSKRATKDH